MGCSENALYRVWLCNCPPTTAAKLGTTAMKRVGREATAAERIALEALAQASTLEELVEIVRTCQICVQPDFISVVIQAFRSSPGGSKKLGLVLDIIHRAVHSGIVHEEETSAFQELNVQLTDTHHQQRWSPALIDSGTPPEFFRHLLKLVDNRTLAPTWTEPRTPEDVELLRQDLARINVPVDTLPTYERSDGIAWSVIACTCFGCQKEVLLARPHFLDSNNGLFARSATENSCPCCGSSKLDLLGIWIQEPPFTDELNALATLVVIGDSHAIYKPPGWGYSPKHHGPLLEARVQDLTLSIQNQGFLKENLSMAVSFSYSFEEYIDLLDKPPTPDAFEAFAASAGFALEYRHSALDEIMTQATRFAATYRAPPRAIQFGTYFPWRQVAAASLNEALAEVQQLDHIDLGYFCAQTAVALSSVTQLSAAQAAILRAQHHLFEADHQGQSDDLEQLAAYLSAAHADIVARQAQGITQVHSVPAGASSCVDRSAYWISRGDQALALKNDGEFEKAVSALHEVIDGVLSLMDDCVENDEQRALHYATIALSAALANLASVALVVPQDSASEFLPSIMSVAIRIDGPLVATIPDDDSRLLARAALRLIEHALFHSLRVGHHSYIARQRSKAAEAFARLGVQDQLESSLLSSVDHALMANDNRFASGVALELVYLNLVRCAFDNALYMTEVASLAAMRYAIDDYTGDQQESSEVSEQVCSVALQIAMQTEAAMLSTIMILENQKALQAAHSLSVALLTLRRAPARVETELETLRLRQEPLRAEALLDEEDETQVRADLTGVMADVERARQRIGAFTGASTLLSDSRSTHHVNIEEIRSMLEQLGERTTLLGFYHDEFHVCAYAIWREAAELCVLDDWTSWEEDIESIIDSMDAGQLLPDSISTVARHLLRPLATRLVELRSWDRLIVSPFGRFGRLPFEALPTSAGSVLSEHVTLSVTAGIGMLKACVRRPTVERSSLLAIGSPNRTIPSPPPFSREEVRSIAARFEEKKKQCTVLVGDEATSSNVRKYCGTRHIVHFACHGKRGMGTHLPSCLFLTEAGESESGIVTAQDIADRYRLMPGSLVVLSACETGEIHTDHMRDETAMVQAFMIAGASSVIATRWAIHDKATSIFMSELYKQLALGEKISNALAMTVRLARAGLLGPGLAKPNVWGAFAMYGC
jgi:CHAT domain-containing protein